MSSSFLQMHYVSLVFYWTDDSVKNYTPRSRMTHGIISVIRLQEQSTGIMSRMLLCIKGRNKGKLKGFFVAYER